jgi:hypothetical protein
MLDDFIGQLEFGEETNIPHYQLALKTNSLCHKKPLLEYFQKSLDAHINIDIQFNYEEMAKYTTKETKFLSDEYSGKIFKKPWNLSQLELKPQLRKALDEPYPWQEFFRKEVMSKRPDDRTIDWVIDPVGCTGKSTFVAAYTEQTITDAVLSDIDNVDRMMLALIIDIEDYRNRYNEDPRIIMFDFARKADGKKIMEATALMESIKTGRLATTFGGRRKIIRIPDVHVVVFSNTPPDLSTLSKDRWRLWRLGGFKYGHIIWPCTPHPVILKKSETKDRVAWCTRLVNIPPGYLSAMSVYKDLNLNPDWFNMQSKGGKETFGMTHQTTGAVVTKGVETPNFIRLAVDEINHVGIS